jgi:hypothetical protein
MSESLHRYFLYHYPALPGGGYTVGAIGLTIATLFLLYRHTKWSGWFAFFWSVAFYSVPVLVEYHRR